MTRIEPSTASLLVSFIKEQIASHSFLPKDVNDLQAVQQALQEVIDYRFLSQNDNREGATLLVLMTEKAYAAVISYVAPTNAEGWIQNCMCGRRFMTQQRTGQCPDCGMGYEILKNRGELSI